ncbi:MAG: shikimate kinase [Muribaculaceae bacterium]|nr:shikimate kinase [Muribaculaceae bacterium]
MKPVFLIGYMCCGKTTLGVELAQQMDLTFIDLDEYIEAVNGMSIIEIFDEMGEQHFRHLETEALRDVAAMSDVIIGCGGGTPCHNDNMVLMNAAGTTVWLTTSPEVLTARLLLPKQKNKRPKILALPDNEVLDFVNNELTARTPYYQQAQLHFDSTDIETAQATTRTAHHLTTLLESVIS